VSSSGRPAMSYVVNSLNPGGTERLVVEMSCAFSDEYSVDVICLDTPGAWAQELRERGVPVHTLWRQPGLDTSMPGKLAKHFRRRGTRVIHAHQCTPWFYSALSRLLYPAPRLLLEEHGRFFPEVENRSRAFVNRALIRKLTHRFVAVSRDIRERLQRYEGLDLRQIEVIYNGVSPNTPLIEAERLKLRRQLGFADTDFIVGTVGRFDPIKNLPMLVSSLAAAGREVESIRGLLVGHGPVFPDIERQIVSEGLQHRLQLTGYRSDARNLAQCMDLFVLSSLSEGTSMALLEAMAASVPVAVTEVGGNPEIVTNGVTGWTVPSGSVPALTAVLIEAARDADKRRRLAEAGQRRFAEQFSMDGMMRAYRDCYRELLAAG
jgi:L-malate glycosyltransferase